MLLARSVECNHELNCVKVCNLLTWVAKSLSWCRERESIDPFTTFEFKDFFLLFLVRSTNLSEWSSSAWSIKSRVKRRWDDDSSIYRCWSYYSARKWVKFHTDYWTVVEWLIIVGEWSCNPETTSCIPTTYKNFAGWGANSELISSEVPAGIKIRLQLFDLTKLWHVLFCWGIFLPHDDASVCWATE